jgi:hypothetical protein
MSIIRRIAIFPLLVIPFFCLGMARPLSAAVYSVELDIAKFGFLGQSDVPLFGAVASAPVAATNSFVYLRNLYPAIYGNGLTGGDLASWISTAQLLGSSLYMDTISNQTTYNRDAVHGMREYMTQKSPPPNGFYGEVVIVDGQDWTIARPQPSGVQTVFPTWQFLYSALSRRESPIIDVFFPTQPNKRRSVTLTSFHWNDLDGDLWIDLGEEGVIDFIDPLDPANDTKTAPKRKYGKIYEEALPPGSPGSRRLRFEFLSDGYSPFSTEDAFISMAFVARDPIPEPGSTAIWGFSFLAGWAYRRRCTRPEKV